MAVEQEQKVRWGIVNFSVRDPQEQISYLKHRVTEAENELKIFIEKVGS